MDDIQFWIYLIFGGIYLVSRFLKKNKKDDTPSRVPKPQQGTPSGRQSKPVSFEELLKEFTEGRSEQEDVVEEAEPIRVEPRKLQQEPVKVEDFSREGRNRQFSDEDSRKIYEESIKNAEGAALNFERDEHFQIKLKSRGQDEESNSEVASEIAEMLRNPDSARKAVILGEILNRKY